MSFKKKLFKNILTLGGYTYSTQIANFLASIILARLLLPEEYGYVALITVFSGFINLFTDAGLSFSIIRSPYGYTFNKASSNLAFYIGILLFILMVLLAWPICLFYDDPSLFWPTIVVSFNFIFASMTIVPRAIVSKDLDFKYVGKVKFLANAASILIMIIMALLGFSYWSLIVPLVLIHIVQLILFDRKVKIGFKLYKFSYTVVAFNKTKSLLLNLSGFNLVNYWASNADTLVIGKYYGNYELGIYKRAFKLMQLMLNLISGLFGTVVYPSLEKFKKSGGDFRTEYISILGVISMVSYSLSALMILVPKQLVWLLWGENWLLVADFLPYFGVLILFRSLMMNNGQLFILLEKEKTFMYIGIIDSIIRIAAIIIGAMYSVKGILIASVLSYLVLVVPIGLYVSYYKTFHYSVSIILRFWMPKIIIGLLIFLFILTNDQVLLIICTLGYLVHIIYFHRKDYVKILRIIKIRSKKT